MVHQPVEKIILFTLLTFSCCVGHEEQVVEEQDAGGDQQLAQISTGGQGTRWCGQGNQARSANDLGEYSRSDLCCRAHDHCRYVINAGDYKWGLLNKESYTISHCTCDKIFHNCLTAKRFDAASCLVWDTYFTMIKPHCFELEKIRNGTKKAVMRKRLYTAPDCSMHNVFREVLRHFVNRLQGKWRRPGQWGDPINDVNVSEE